LGSVDLYGTTYIENMLATGFGMHMAVPLLRKNWRADMNEQEARTLLEDCMRVLYYRDARTINKVRG
jgi:20S proteasome subunit beta 7